MDELLSTTDAHKALDVPLSTFTWYVRKGIVNPAMPGRGQGSMNIFTVQQVWAIGIAKSIRGGGQPLEVAMQAATILEKLTPKQVETAFAEGRTCLLVVSVDGQMEIMPRLVSPSAIIDNPHLRDVRKEAEKNGQTLMFFGIDTKPMLEQITSKVKEQTAQRKSAAKRS
jgi:hypothetical protein